MLIELDALTRELPALAGRSTQELCELLAGLGFPIDGVEDSGTSPVLDVDVTANRGDAQSHRSLARDLAAKLGADLSPLPHQPLAEGEALVPIRLEAGPAGPLYATAVLELGKGATPRDEWPRHIGHEERGLTLIEALCQRLRVPNEYRDLALITAKYHGVCHHAEELRPATLLDTLQALDALRRPERFEQFLLACEADSTGRPGYEQQPYTQAALLRDALRIALTVDGAALAAKGLKGEAMAEELRRLRIAAIRAARTQDGSGPDEPV